MIRDWGNCKRSTLTLNSQKYISAYDGGVVSFVQYQERHICVSF